MSQARGTDGRWEGKKTFYVPVRMNDDDLARIEALISAGVGENASEVIRYALHNCSNDSTLNGA